MKQLKDLINLHVELSKSLLDEWRQLRYKMQFFKLRYKNLSRNHEKFDKEYVFG